MSTDSTLFRQIQALFERTYTSVGVNLEDCIIGQRRCRQLEKAAGAAAAELSEAARTFLRTSGGRLHVGIYFSSWLIEQLEKHDPRAGLSESNIRELIAFVEEINHALHASLKFLAGEQPEPSEDYARNLELQAQVDTYLVLLLFASFFRRPGRLTAMDRKWLRFHMFESECGMRRHAGLRARYMETTWLAARYTAFLDGLRDRCRVMEIRTFHALSYDEKKARILSLPAAGE